MDDGEDTDTDYDFEEENAETESETDDEEVEENCDTEESSGLFETYVIYPLVNKQWKITQFKYTSYIY